MQVLIAEDSRTARMMLTSLLRKWGFDPVSTETGKAAWEVMQRPDAPKLVILDWVMPEMDGLEVCRRVRQLGSLNPPYIIFVTAQSTPENIIQALNAGADDYIHKPYNRGELQARINVGKRIAELQEKLTEAWRSMAYQAYHDPLTGILSRRAILELLGKEIARSRRDKNGLSVGLLDVDLFKKINDTHGHLVGDDILSSVARLAMSSLRHYDHVGRYGGDELLIVTPKMDEAEGNVYERLRSVIASTPGATRSGEIPVTVSIGVAAATIPDTAESLLARADEALYRAKEEGRNRVVCLSPQPRNAIIEARGFHSYRDMPGDNRLRR
jgi:two-component system cell cycle response regulator